MSFSIGQRVRVAAREHDGHRRTPGYLEGKSGVVERLHGTFPNPEARAYGSDGLPALELYQVGFAQRDVWTDYAGPADDRISVDVFAHWLERAG